MFRARPGTADLFGLTGVAGVVEAAPANSVTVQVSATFPIGASESVLRATLQRFKDAGCHIIIMFTSRSGMAGWAHAGQSYQPTVPNVLFWESCLSQQRFKTETCANLVLSATLFF